MLWLNARSLECVGKGLPLCFAKVEIRDICLSSSESNTTAVLSLSVSVSCYCPIFNHPLHLPAVVDFLPLYVFTIFSQDNQAGNQIHGFAWLKLAIAVGLRR